MEEEIIIQTADEVSNIDYMKTTNDMLSEQNNQMQDNINMISEQLDVILDNTNSITPAITTDTNLSEVTQLIEDIDTTIVEANTQDILVKLNNQQQQINDINEKLNLILSKL